MKNFTLFLIFFTAFISVSSFAQNKKYDIAINDTFIVRNALPNTYNVLVNDFGTYDNKITKLTIVTEPTKGTLKVESIDGVDKIIYKIKDVKNESDDFFTYRVCDKNNNCDTARATIIKCPSSNPAFPKYDLQLVQKNDTVTYNYPNNVIMVSKKPINGILKLSADSSKAQYIPNKDFLGNDGFKFTVYHKSKFCGMHHVESIEADVYLLPSNEENKPPIANIDEVSTPKGRKIDIAVLDNDTDPEGSLHRKIIDISFPSHGEIKRTTKVVTYTPKPGFTGKDQMIYQVCDYNGACVDGKVIITIK